ncbi:MAG: hypothetical protein P8Y97_11450 [Candidatus Lokiarchaeota archaeon]
MIFLNFNENLKREFLIQNGVNFPSYYTPKIPIFSKSIFSKHLNNIEMSKIGYNPFGFFNYNFFDDQDLENYKKELFDFFLPENLSDLNINKDKWYNTNSFWVFTSKVIGERTFFDTVIREFVFNQNNPFLNDWMPTSITNISVNGSFWNLCSATVNFTR